MTRKRGDVATSAELAQREAVIRDTMSVIRRQYPWAKNAGYTRDTGEPSDVRRPIHESDPTRTLVITEQDGQVRLNRRKEQEREVPRQVTEAFREAERLLQAAAFALAAVVGEPVEVQQGKPGMDDDAWRGYVAAQQRRIARGEAV